MLDVSLLLESRTSGFEGFPLVLVAALLWATPPIPTAPQLGYFFYPFPFHSRSVKSVPVKLLLAKHVPQSK